MNKMKIALMNCTHIMVLQAKLVQLMTICLMVKCMWYNPFETDAIPDEPDCDTGSPLFEQERIEK